MSEESKSRMQAKRLRRSLVVVAILVSTMAFSDNASAFVADALGKGAALSSAGTLFTAYGEAPDAYRLISFAVPPSAQVEWGSEGEPDIVADLPPGLAELGIPLQARDMRVDGTQNVLSYALDGTAADSLEAVSASMRSAGWKGVALGNLTGATFTKPEGELRWALVTCTGVPDAGETTVVVRVMRHG